VYWPHTAEYIYISWSILSLANYFEPSLIIACNARANPSGTTPLGLIHAFFAVLGFSSKNTSFSRDASDE
jgi:hypothetical protein